MKSIDKAVKFKRDNAIIFTIYGFLSIKMERRNRLLGNFAGSKNQFSQSIKGEECERRKIGESDGGRQSDGRG